MTHRGPVPRRGAGPTWSTAWSWSPTRRRSPPLATSAPCWGAGWGRPRAPTCGAAFGLLAEMVADGRGGSVVTLLADSGDRYADTYFSDEWVSAQGLDLTGPAEALVEFERTCTWI